MAQWTSAGRKAGLLELSRRQVVSIGDEDMQMDYVEQELTTGYKSVLNALSNATSVKEASDIVCTKYERPADQSEKALERRAALGEQFYKELVEVEYMAYTNSPLVNYTKISPNKTVNRNHKIDTIIIHCVVGQVTIERLGEIFANSSRKASSNYGVDKNGRIGLFVEEKDRSWCSGGTDKNGNPIRVNGISGADNDHRAITIEVASDTVAPYAVTDSAFNSLIRLCADICKRNNIKELRWKGDKSLVGKTDLQNMTVHRWFANKSCPGDYLYERHGLIASKVNELLGVKTIDVAQPVLRKGSKGYQVSLLQSNLNEVMTFNLDADGVFGSNTENALISFQGKYNLVKDGVYGPASYAKMKEVLEEKEKDTVVPEEPKKEETAEKTYCVHVGNLIKETAEALKSELVADGYEAVVI